MSHLKVLDELKSFIIKCLMESTHGLEMVEDVATLPRALNVDDHASDVANSLAMAKVLDKLTVAYRSTLVEIYFEGNTTQGAAEVLDVPIGTVKSRLHKGLSLLREYVEREELRLSA